MRLFLAVAVLMLAFVAYTEAQDDTMKAKLSKFGEQVSEMGTNLAEQVKSTFQDINNSETANTIRDWWADKVKKVKEHFQ